jgi:homoserine acetyltransferase
VVYSESDRIVAPAESSQFATVLGAETAVFFADERVGHDDFVAAPEVIAELINRLKRFYATV